MQKAGCCFCAVTFRVDSTHRSALSWVHEPGVPDGFILQTLHVGGRTPCSDFRESERQLALSLVLILGLGGFADLFSVRFVILHIPCLGLPGDPVRVFIRTPPVPSGLASAMRTSHCSGKPWARAMSAHTA